MRKELKSVAGACGQEKVRKSNRGDKGEIKKGGKQ